MARILPAPMNQNFSQKGIPRESEFNAFGIRGCSPEFIFEHYRKRNLKEEGKAPNLADKYNCDLEPGSRTRELGTVQRASVTYKRDLDAYGDSYYLVVRCEGGWFGTEGTQRFAAVVELSHSSEMKLYEKIRQPLRVQV